MGRGGFEAITIIIMVLVYIAIFAVPVAQLLYRTGHSRLWVLLAFVPLVNIIFLWIWAFKRWPVDPQV